MQILNAYYSKGSMISPEDNSKVIKWDNIVFEGIKQNNYQNFETGIFGGKFEKVKIKKEDFERLSKNPVNELMGKDVEFYYNSAKQLVQISILGK